MKCVEFKNVSLRYEKDVELLKDINFSIEEGEIVSIIGANGVGKSTIAKMIMGLLSANSGSITVFGLPIDSNNSNDRNIEKIRSQAGYVFQNPDNQFVGNTVADDVAFRLENNLVKQKEMDKIIDDKLIEVGMLDYKKYEPSSLSGGQKQRVAIASNIVVPLKLLILDESTSMIDPKGKKDIINIVLNVKKENPNMTIIMITHNMDETLFSNRVLVVDNGVIAFDGAPKTLFQNNELLQRFQLNEPFNFELAKKMSENGYDVSYDSSYEEMVNKLCQSK
jgi:energy-coupling factor transport system ATP-binding protein